MNRLPPESNKLVNFFVLTLRRDFGEATPIARAGRADAKVLDQVLK
jgi:hypothetical protein